MIITNLLKISRLWESIMIAITIACWAVEQLLSKGFPWLIEHSRNLTKAEVSPNIVN